MEKLLVYDIGGTFIKWATLDKELTILEKGSFQTFEDDTELKCKNMLDRVVQHINEIKKSNDIYKVGISSACVINTDTGMVIGDNPVFKGYVGLNIYEIVKDGTGLDCVAMNDGNSGVLGEFVKGAIKDVHSAVMVVLGTGVGSGTVYNGKVFEGFNFWAGEVGSYKVEGKTWEDFASVASLCRQVSQELGEEVNGRWILENLETNGIVKEVYKKWIGYVAIGIANIFHTIGPEIILIGGGVSENPAFKIEDIMEALKPIVNVDVHNAIKIKKASLGNDANIYGVASLLIK